MNYLKFGFFALGGVILWALAFILIGLLCPVWWVEDWRERRKAISGVKHDILY